MLKSIDVVLATYNGEPYLSEQLLTIQGSGDVHLDSLIVSDDGSNDGTLDVVNKFESLSSLRVQVVQKKYNQVSGAKQNFCRGLSKTTAKYVMFSDQDDVWLDCKVPKSFDKIKSLENQFGAETPILIFSDLKVVDSNLNIINDSFFSYQGVFPNWADDFPHLLMQNVAPGCTMIINRALIDKAGEIPDDALMHDWWFMLVASAFGKIAYIDEPTILYRQHENNCIGAKSSSIISTIKAFLKAPLSIVGVVNQAKAFLDIYDDELKIVLSKNDYGKLILQTQLISLPVHKRWLAVICGGIRKNTFIRNLGLLLALTIFKLK